MVMYKVSYEGNWAGEMNIEAYKIFNDKKYNLFKKILDKLETYCDKHKDDDGFTVGIGTNEDISVKREDFIIKKISLTDDEYKLLKRLKLFEYDPQRIFDYLNLSNYYGDFEEDDSQDE